MNGPVNLVVTESGSAHPTLAELVMAWARDTESGEPRYILELDANHRGAKCGCECPSCGLPLTAVNAAKAQFVRRPHFRHPEGALRDECLVLSARVAALRQLQEDGWLNLPRRRMSARVAGLSGEFHEAWVEEPPVRLRISEVSYHDRAYAVVTLEDGQQLLVALTGTIGGSDASTQDGLPTPTIYLAVTDPILASLPPDELRRRARLQPTELCWHSHWADEGLLARAGQAALAEADYYFDVVPQWLELPEGLAPELKRETVLHYEVKRLLAEAGRLTVPKVVIEDSVSGPGGRSIQDSYVEEEEELRLVDVELESRYGRLIPDITCEAFGSDGHARHLPLLIEVTVTNHIDEERLGRIQSSGEATLEIDLSLAGGRVNRDELRRLVLGEVATKRWLFRPDLAWLKSTLREQLLKRAADEQTELDAREAWLAQRRAEVLATPVSQIVADYLQAVTKMLDAIGDPAAVRAAREGVSDIANRLSLHGYPEAGDEQLIGSRGVLTYVISIQLGRALGHRYSGLMGALRSMREETGFRRTHMTVYFIAERAYPLELDAEDRAWFDDWASEVRESIRAKEAAHLRDPFYDRFLALAFPEMAEGLAKNFGKLSMSHELTWDATRGMFIRPHEVPVRRPAKFLEKQPRSDASRTRLLDTKPGQWWLQGRDLEAWKRANPEAAAAWFPNLDANRR